MSFTANKTFDDLVTAALASALPGHITTVATEQGITLDAIRANYTAEEPSMLYPSTLQTPTRGVIDDSGSISTQAEGWVLITAVHERPSTLKQQLTGYITALVRTFNRAAFGGYMFEALEYDMSPPTISENATIQTAGVRVSATIIESP